MVPFSVVNFTVLLSKVVCKDYTSRCVLSLRKLQYMNPERVACILAY